MRLRIYFIAVISFVHLTATQAQEGAYQVKDLNPAIDESQGSEPAGFTRLGDEIIFTAWDGVGRLLLWKTDGTAEGTQRLQSDAADPLALSAEEFFITGATAYFTATYASEGRELWKTDGTAEGTVLVKNIDPTLADPGSHSGIGDEANFVELNGIVYFIANDGTHGMELWRTDGSETGTHMVRDINEQPAFPEGNTDWAFDSDGSSDRLRVAGDMLFLEANDGIHGFELWKSDGTAEGTALVMDIHDGPEDSLINTVFPVGDLVFIVARDENHNSRLWRSDGSPAGTFELIGPDAENPFGDPNLRVSLNGGVYFTAASHGDSLIYSDGTNAGTVQVSGDNVLNVAVANETVFFIRLDFEAFNSSLWTTDGSPGGTLKIKDFDEGVIAYDTRFAGAGGVLFFTYSTIESGDLLWVSDGTEGGTLPLLEPAGEELTFLIDGVEFDGQLLFVWLVQSGESFHHELYLSDGTPLGTEKIQDLWASVYYGFGLLDGQVLFTNGSENPDDPSQLDYNLELWSTDGQSEGTGLLADLLQSPQDSGIADITSFGGRVLFSADDGVHGREPWVSDGTEAGTSLLADLTVGAAGTSVTDFTEFRQKIFFHAAGKLWASDGTAAGTELIKDIFLESARHIAGMVVVGDQLAIAAQTLFYPYAVQLWVSDGTPDGTTRIQVADFVGFQGMEAIGNKLYFLGYRDAGAMAGVWTSDLTSEGTILVRSMTSLPFGNVSDSAAVAGERYIFPVPGVHPAPSVLWASDGTEAGTIELAAFPTSGFALIIPMNLTGAGNQAFFTLRVGTGTQLWVTDGTSGGTSTVKLFTDNIAAEYGFITSGPLCYFVAGDQSVDGVWRSDGTIGGTYSLLDQFTTNLVKSPFGEVFFVPVVSSGPEAIWRTNGTLAGTAPLDMGDISPLFRIGFGTMAFAGDRAFFIAADDTSNYELWAIDLGLSESVTLNIGLGDTAPRTFGSLGVTADFSANSAQGDMTVTLWRIAPPGLSNTAGNHWRIDGLESSAYLAILIFSYDEDDLAERGLNENALALFRSEDNGLTWQVVASDTDTQANTIRTLDPVSAFSLWAVGAEAPNSANRWTLYH